MSEEETPKFVLHRLEEAELAQLAVDIAEFRTYLAAGEEGIRWSFALVIQLAADQLRDHVDEIGAFYESMSKALPRSVNGYPMFMSMKILHRDDLPLVVTKIEEYHAMQQSFVQGGSRILESDGEA